MIVNVTPSMVFRTGVVLDVDIRNTVDAITGELEVSTDTDVVETKKLTVPNGLTRYRFESVGFISGTWTVTFKTKLGKFKDQVKGQHYGGSQLRSLVLATRPADDLRQIASRWGEAVEIRPRAFPRTLEALSMFDKIFVQAGLEQLSKEQIELLAGWMLSGGALVLYNVGKTFDINSAPYSSFAPAAPTTVAWGAGRVNYLAPAATKSEAVLIETINKMDTYNYEQSDHLVTFSHFSRPTTAASLRQSGPGNASPFLIKLPTISFIGGVMISFFVIAVPITMGILKRIKRAELAWITTPVFAIIASSILFGGSRSLSDLPSSSQVVVDFARLPGIGTVGAGMVSAYFSKSGMHRLKMQNWMGLRGNASPEGQSRFATLLAKDESVLNDEIQYSSSNREFRNFAGAVMFSDELRLEAKLIWSKFGPPVLRLYNPSPFEFESASLDRQLVNAAANYSRPQDAQSQSERVLALGPIPAHSVSEFKVFDEALLELFRKKLPNQVVPSIWFKTTLTLPDSVNPWGSPGGGFGTFRQPLMLREEGARPR